MEDCQDMPTISEQKHRGAVANYLAGKVREFGYQLRVVVDACEAASNAGRNCDNGAIVAYGFSALTNAMQSLKDGVTTIGGAPLTWPMVALLPHGEFMGKARNAATHDGNPIVNCWVDGHYFIAMDIARLDMRGDPVEIIRPKEDIRTICLQFAGGFAALLRDRLRPMLGQYSIGGAPFDRAEFETIISGADIIPAAVKEMVASRIDEIGAAIEKAPPFDPVADAFAELEQLIAYVDAGKFTAR